MSRARLIATIVLIVFLAGVIAYGYETRSSIPASQHFESGTLGSVSLNLELATTSAVRERGLSGRTEIPDRYGMLFAFPNDNYYGFWMKDTLVPLDMFWLDSKGQVIYYLEDVEPSTYPHVFYPDTPARYVLETRAGFAEAYRVATGTVLLLKNFPIVSE